MNNDFTHTELLIQYIDGELPAADRPDFETLIRENESWQEEIMSLQAARTAIRSWGIRSTIKDVHLEMIDSLAPSIIKRITPRSIGWYGLRAAAAAVLVLLIAAAIQYINLSPSQLYRQAYVGFELPVKRSENKPSVLEEDFRSKNYGSVISQFEGGSASGSSDYFIAGQAFLETGNDKQASACFEKVIELNKEFKTTTYQDDAEYYLALSYLRQNELNRAIPLFRSIYNDKEHLYNDRVNPWLLRKLKILKWKG